MSVISAPLRLVLSHVVHRAERPVDAAAEIDWMLSTDPGAVIPGSVG